MYTGHQGVDCVGTTQPQEVAWTQTSGSGCRWLGAAPLAGAAAAQDKGGRVALLAHARLSWAAALQGAGGAAEEALHQFMEEVAREEHVDPGVAAAVEAGQEHGDDEGRGCGGGKRPTGHHYGSLPAPSDLATVS